MSTTSQAPSVPHSAARALLFNRQHIVWIEIPVPHRLDHHPNGWRIDLVEPTTIAVHLQGDVVKVSLGAGDVVQCSGDNVYLGVRRRSQDPQDPKEPADPKGRSGASDEEG